MASRSVSRRHALQILFASDANGVPAGEVLADYVDSAGKPADEFTRSLVSGVDEHMGEIDAILGRKAKEWKVDRMPSVDRSVLRLACFEMLYLEEVPVAVAIDEAVEAAKELSTEESAGFVNGVLGAIARDSAADEAGAGAAITPPGK